MATATKKPRVKFGVPLTITDSTLITAIYYDPDTKTLDVVMARKKADGSDSRYRYKRVPTDTFARLVTAKSKGSFFSKKIRNVYAFEEWRKR